MAKIYNQIGSLTQLTDKLKEKGIQDFETMDDIRAFRSGYQRLLREIKQEAYDILKRGITDLELKHRELSSGLSNDKKNRETLLRNELMGLDKFLSEGKEPNNPLGKLFFRLKKWRTTKKRNALKHSFEDEVGRPFKKMVEKIELLQSEINDKKNNREKWVEEYRSDKVRRLEFILSVFKENRFLFYGAEGEEQALRELSKLPDTYTVINDYHLRFQTPIYDRRSDDRIFSVQIDHIVVGPTGIYLIETKNWSKNSVESRGLFSPVRQLRRHNFAMFVLLNQAVEMKEIKGFWGNWGERKISPKNIVLLTGYRPREKYQHVELVSVSEVVKYISYKQKIFNEEETESLVDYLNCMTGTNR